MNNPFFNFLAEFVKRLFQEKPKFFATLQFIAFLTGGISAGIMYFKTIHPDLPSWIDAFGSLNLIVGSVVAIIMAQLPNKG